MSISDEVKNSGLFDRDWYLAKYRDVGISGIQPLAHFVRIGMKIGRDPGPRFNTRYYIEQAPEASNVDVSPLLHYIRVGKAKGLRAVPPKDNTGVDQPAPEPRQPRSAPPTTQAPQIGPAFRSGRDAFMLRGLRPMAKLAVIVSVVDEDGWTRAIDLLTLLKLDHDLFVLGQAAVETSVYPGQTISVTEVGGADSTGDTVSFLRLAISNVFDDYDAALWITPAEATDEALMQSVGAAEAFLSDSDCGIMSGHLIDINTVSESDRIISSLKTMLPRLGLNMPESAIVPIGGAIWLRPLLFRGLGPTIYPGDLAAKTSKVNGRGRVTMLSLLSIFAREAAFAVQAVPPAGAAGKVGGASDRPS